MYANILVPIKCIHSLLQVKHLLFKEYIKPMTLKEESNKFSMYTYLLYRVNELRTVFSIIYVGDIMTVWYEPLYWIQWNTSINITQLKQWVDHSNSKDARLTLNSPIQDSRFIIQTWCKHYLSFKPWCKRTYKFN